MSLVSDMNCTPAAVAFFFFLNFLVKHSPSFKVGNAQRAYLA